MTNLNRIKVVLVEQQKIGKWLAEQMGKSACTVSNGVATPVSLTWLHWTKLLNY